MRFYYFAAVIRRRLCLSYIPIPGRTVTLVIRSIFLYERDGRLYYLRVPFVVIGGVVTGDVVTGVM